MISSNEVCSSGSASRYDVPQPALDSRVDLNSMSDDGFGFVNASLFSSPQADAAAKETPISTDSLEDPNISFDQYPNYSASPQTIFPSTSAPTIHAQPNPNLIPRNLSPASMSPTAVLLQGQPLSDVRERCRIDPSPSQIHRCPHCQRHFVDSRRFE